LIPPEISDEIARESGFFVVLEFQKSFNRSGFDVSGLISIPFPSCCYLYFILNFDFSPMFQYVTLLLILHNILATKNPCDNRGLR